MKKFVKDQAGENLVEASGVLFREETTDKGVIHYWIGQNEKKEWKILGEYPTFKRLCEVFNEITSFLNDKERFVYEMPKE